MTECLYAPGTLQVDTGKMSSMGRKQMPGRGFQADGQHRQRFKGGKYSLMFQGSIREYALAGAKGVKREEVQDTFGLKVWGQIMEGLK